jgi:purine-binding chemotaxis protein CheW
MTQDATLFENGAVDVLTFDLQGEIFAIEATLVQEVLDKAPETAVPGAPAFVNAVINFRGRIIPLADLRLAFNMDTRDASLDSRIIVIAHEMEGEATLIGLRADKVYEVTTLNEAATEAPPRIGLRWRQDFIHCLAKRDDDIIVVPNLAAIFAARGQPRAGAAVSLNSQSTH